MKVILTLIFLFSAVACESKNKKNNETKNVSTISTTKEDESITDVELPETQITPTSEIQTEEEPEIPNVVIADPQLEPEPKPEPELEPVPEQPTAEEQTPEAEPQTEPIPETLPPVVIEEPGFDYTNLILKGIHIVGRSTLHEIRNPSAIYCSNTQHFNYEKAEELKMFSDTLHGEEIIVMDETKMSVSNLKSLIEQAITTLEISPQSRYCPRIYLAIESSR